MPNPKACRLREIRLTAGFIHPHILPLLYSGQFGGLPKRAGPGMTPPHVPDQCIGDCAISSRIA